MNNNSLPLVNYKNISHDGIRTLAERVCADWSVRENVPPTITMIIAKVKRNLPIHLKVMMHEQGSSYTELVKEADAKRDKAFQLFLRKVKSNLLEFDENLVSAASQILAAVAMVGMSLHMLPYSEQSAKTKQLLISLRSAEHREAIDMLGLNKDLSRIEEFNIQFESSWETRVNDTAQDEDLPPLRSVREEIQDGLRLLFKNSEFLHQEDHPSVDEEFFKKLSLQIQEMAS